MVAESIFCTNCATSMSKEAFSCPSCGHPNAARINRSGPKNRVTAGVLALLVGGLGVHKFYLDKIGLGIVYLLFCWTFIPSIIAFVEGIVYLTQTDEAFDQAQGIKSI